MAWKIVNKEIFPEFFFVPWKNVRQMGLEQHNVLAHGRQVLTNPGAVYLILKHESKQNITQNKDLA